MKTTIIALLAIAMLLLSRNANSQVTEGKLTEIEKSNADLLIKLINDLKKAPTVKLLEHAGPPVAKEEELYRKLMSKYIDENKLRQLFEQDTSHLKVEASFDFYRHGLYYLDYALDKVSSDMVIIRPKTARKGGLNSDNSVDLILVISSREIPMGNFSYDQSLKKFSMVQFLGYDNSAGIAEFWKDAN